MTTFKGIEIYSNSPAMIEFNAKRGVAKQWRVRVAHAGRTDRTGGKIHTATATLYADGTFQVGAARCSSNGMLRGTLICGDGDFVVTCKKCGAGTREGAETVVIDGGAR